MLHLFSDPEYMQILHDEAFAEPATPPTLGFLEQTGMGLMRGGAKAGRALGVLGGALAVPFGEETADDYFGTVDDLLGDAVDYWTPDPRTTTTAGQIVGGLAEIVIPLMLGGAAPLMATMGTDTMVRLTDQGVGPEAAIPAGLVDAFATGLGFLVPTVGKTLAGTLGYGVGGNVALGAGAELAQRELLSSAGYDEQAQQYDPWRLESRAIEALMGGVFGGLAHVSQRPAVDAVRTHLNAARAASRAPGIPTNLKSATAHDAALRETINAMAEDRAPRIDMGDATFARTAAMDAPRVDIEAPTFRAYDDVLPAAERQAAAAAMEDAADARAALAANPDMVIPTEDGGYVRAADAMKAADADFEEASATLPRIVEAALSCAVRQL